MAVAGRAAERPPRRREPRISNTPRIGPSTPAAAARPPLEALDVTGNLVFAGNGYVINKTKINPYEGLDVKGKIIVVAGLPAELAAQQAAAVRAAGARRGGAAAAPPAAADAAPAPANGPGGRRRIRWAKPVPIF